MKKCHVINKQEDYEWAELYSAKLKGYKEGYKEGKKMIIERLIEDEWFEL